MSYEAPTPQLFQQYQVDRDAMLARLEFGVIPVQSFNYFEALELEIVPDGKAKLKTEEITKISEDIRKELERKPGSFKEIRPSRTQITEKPLLLTTRARFRSRQHYHRQRVAPRSRSRLYQ